MHGRTLTLVVLTRVGTCAWMDGCAACLLSHGTVARGGQGAGCALWVAWGRARAAHGPGKACSRPGCVGPRGQRAHGRQSMIGRTERERERDTDTHCAACVCVCACVYVWVCVCIYGYNLCKRARGQVWQAGSALSRAACRASPPQRPCSRTETRPHGLWAFIGAIARGGRKRVRERERHERALRSGDP
jgi:hypothetical protein